MLAESGIFEDKVTFLIYHVYAILEMLVQKELSDQRFLDNFSFCFSNLLFIILL